MYTQDHFPTDTVAQESRMNRRRNHTPDAGMLASTNNKNFSFCPCRYGGTTLFTQKTYLNNERNKNNRLIAKTRCAANGSGLVGKLSMGSLGGCKKKELSRKQVLTGCSSRKGSARFLFTSELFLESCPLVVKRLLCTG